MLELLAFAFQALPYGMAFGSAILLFLAAWGAYGSPVVGVTLMAVAYLLSTYFGDVGLPVGVTIYGSDLVMILLAVVLLVRALRGHLIYVDGITKAWLVLGSVWFGLFMVGVPLYKSIAGVGFRPYFHLWVAVAYMLSFCIDATQRTRIVNVLMWASVAMCLLVVYRWAQIALEVRDLPWRESATSIRVVSSSAAQLLALCLLAGVSCMVGLAKPQAAWSAFALLLIGVVLLLQHRTVWAVLIASLAVTFALATQVRHGRSVGLLMPVLLPVVLVGSLLLLAPESKVTAGLGRTVAEVGQEKNTLDWRVDSWRELLKGFVGSGPTVWPFGRPFGSDTRRYIEAGGAYTSVSAHSTYVSLLVNGGIVALAAYMFAQFAALKRLLRARPAEPEGVSPATLALLVIATMVYAISYGVDYMQGVFLGLAYSHAVAMRVGEAPAVARGDPSVGDRDPHWPKPQRQRGTR